MTPLQGQLLEQAKYRSNISSHFCNTVLKCTNNLNLINFLYTGVYVALK